MTSPVDVANMALDNIGARFTVTSLTPPAPGPNAEVLARQYQPRIDALFRAAHWNCARVQAPLTVLKAAQGTPENPDGTTLPKPPVPWLYAYAYPADCLKVRFLLPNPPADGGFAIPVFGGGTLASPGFFSNVGWKFAVALDTDTGGNRVKVILSDLQYADAVITARITDPDLWDPHFLTAAAATLGAFVCIPINGSDERLKMQIEIASGIITQARVSDGNEGVTSIDHVPDWMAVRGVVGFDGIGGPFFYCGWDPMGFPGGVLI